MEYVIVEFEDQAIAIVCKSWVTVEAGIMHTYWPSNSQTRRAEKKEVPDTKAWSLHEVRFLSYAATFEQAQRRVKRAEETSNIESADDVLKRKSKPPKRLHESSDELSNDDENIHAKKHLRLPEKPEFRSPARVHGLGTAQKNVSSEENGMDFLQETNNLGFSPTPSYCSSRSTKDNGMQRKMFQTIMRNQETLLSNQKTIMELLLVRDAQASASRDEEFDLLASACSTVEDLQTLCDRLSDPLVEKKAVAFLGGVGGLSVNETVRLVLKKIGTAGLWSQFSLQGRKKKSFSALPLMSILIKAVRKMHPDAKEDQIISHVGEHLKHSPSRTGGTLHTNRKQKAEESRH